MRAEETEEELRKVHPWDHYLATDQYSLQNEVFYDDND